MTLNVFKKYIVKTKEYISKMNDFQVVLYGYIIAKRFFPFYKIFSDTEGFGNPKILLSAQNLIHEYLINNNCDIKTISKLKDEIDSIIPDSNEYDCSDAMDAGSIHLYILEFLLSKNKNNINYIANLVYDLLDRYAQAALSLDNNSQESETLIENHKIVLSNIKNEYVLFEELLENKMKNENIDILIDKGNIQYQLV